MSQPYMIRLAKPGDVPRVLALQQTVPEAPRWSEATYQGFVQPAPDAPQRKALLVAMECEDLKGFAAVTSLADEAELESIAVATDARRSGLGSALLDAAARWSGEQGANMLHLEVRATNTPAQALYKAKAFRQVGLRRGYYCGPADDGVLMLLELTPGERHRDSKTRDL